MWTGGGRLGLRYQADKHESQPSSLLIDGKDAGGILERSKMVGSTKTILRVSQCEEGKE